jgi:transcription elongation factor
MPEALSFTEIGTQHLELLPARTVMSLVMTAATEGAAAGGAATGTATGGGTEGASTPAKDPLNMVKDLPLLGKLMGS